MKRERNIYIFFIILSFILLLSPEASFAQQLLFSPRENIIFTTLNQLQNREEAVRDAMKDAQMKLVEARITETRTKTKAKVHLLEDLSSRTHPYLSTGTAFSDNVDGDSEPRKSAIVYTYKPGLKLNLLGRNRSSLVDIFINSSYYDNRSRSNTQDAGITILNNFVIGRYALSIYEKYNTTHIAQSHFGIDKTVAHYWSNVFNPILRTNFNRLDLDIGYKHLDYDYEADYSGGDHHEDTFTFHQSLSLTTKMSLSLEYDRVRKQYAHPLEASGNSITDRISLSLNEILSPITTGSISSIYETEDPKEGAQQRIFGFSVSTGYRITKRSDLGLSMQYLQDRQSQSKVGFNNEWSFSLSGNHRFAFNPKFNLSLAYANNYRDLFKTENSDQETKSDSFSFGLSYAFKRWLDFNLKYSYAKTNKNFEPHYYINSVTFTTEARF